MEKKTIPNKAELWLDSENVFHFKMLPRSFISEPDAEEICKVAASISSDVVHCNLVDISQMTFMDRKARAVFAGQKKSTVLGVAIVSNSVVQKSLINLYFNFSKPTIPTKFFNSVDEAKNWLVAKMK